MSDTPLDSRATLKSPIDITAWFAGLGFVGLTIWGAVGGGTSLFMFVDYPSLCIVSGSAISLTIVAFGWRRCVHAVCSLWHLDATDDERMLSAAVFRLSAAFALGGGFLGSMIGMIKMLANMSDPASVGGGVAVALLCPLYGVMSALLLATFAVAVHRKRLPKRQLAFASQSLGVMSAFIAIGTLVACLGFGVILLSMSGVR